MTAIYFDPPSKTIDYSMFSSEAIAILEIINQKIAAAENLNAVMDFLFRSGEAIFPCDRIGLGFLEENDRRITSRWAKAHYEPLLLGNGYTEDLAGSSLETILKSGQVRIIDDLESYFESHPKSRSTRILLMEGVRSSMTCPLKVEGRIIGLLWRSSRKKYAYEKKEAMMHLAVAERLSQAVDKAYRIDQLTAANHAYLEMLGFVSHELKSPVSSMVLDAKMLIEGYLGNLLPEQSRQVEKLIRKGEYLLSIVREYLDLSRLDGGELTPNFRMDVDFVQEVIQPSIDIISAIMTEKKMRLISTKPDEKRLVHCDSDLLKIVMINLLSNAVKYGYESSEIQLDIKDQQTELEISVRNDGPGFEAADRSKLFRRFSRLDAPELRKQKGTGVGLYTVWRIIQLHHGRIQAESEAGKWAQFIINLPQPLTLDV
jgi:signal transduction histidine kinase